MGYTKKQKKKVNLLNYYIGGSISLVVREWREIGRKKKEGVKWLEIYIFFFPFIGSNFAKKELPIFVEIRTLYRMITIPNSKQHPQK